MSQTVRDLWDFVVDMKYDELQDILDTEVKFNDSGKVTNFYGLILLEIKTDDEQVHYARFSMGEPVDNVCRAVAKAAGDVQ